MSIIKDDQTEDENVVEDDATKKDWQNPDMKDLPLSKTQGGASDFFETDSGVWFDS